MSGRDLVAQVLVDQDDVRREACRASVEDHRHLADTVGGVAVGAHARLRAGGLLAQTTAVRRTGAFLDARNRVIDATVDDLVAADHVADPLRTVD